MDTDRGGTTDDDGVDGLQEHAFSCPYCAASITMLLDLSEPDQQYVEDCEVCCNPIGVRVRARRGALTGFDAAQLG